MRRKKGQQGSKLLADSIMNDAVKHGIFKPDGTPNIDAAIPPGKTNPPVQYINVTPRGMETPEGVKRVNAAMKAFEEASAAVASAAMQFFHEHRALILESLTLAIQAKHGTPDEHAALRDDLHQLDALLGARQRKHEAFARAVAGALEESSA